jgi:hypothetical protein
LVDLASALRLLVSFTLKVEKQLRFLQHGDNQKQNDIFLDLDRGLA